MLSCPRSHFDIPHFFSLILYPSVFERGAVSGGVHGVNQKIEMSLSPMVAVKLLKR